MVLSISVLVFGLILAAFCYKLMDEGGEMADEALTGFFAGIVLALFLAVFIAKKLGDYERKKRRNRMNRKNNTDINGEERIDRDADVGFSYFCERD